jgi:hypothetical protein
MPKAARRAAPRIPRLLLVAGSALVVAGGGALVLRFMEQPPPVISSILPPRVEGGGTVTLAGTDLGSDPKSVVVRFGKQAGTIVSLSATQLAVTLPEVKPKGGRADVPVVVERGGVLSNQLFITVVALPKIAALRPDVAMPGETVAVSGKALDGEPLMVLVGGQPAEVIERGPEELRLRVPDLPVLPGRPAPVLVRAGSESSKPVPLLLGRLPLLIEVQPRSGMAGDRVRLRGRGFDASPAGNRVQFGGLPALLFSATEEELAVAVPSAPGGVQGEAEVAVEVRGRTSNPQPFTITRLSAGTFTPRFFPAPVPGDPARVFVSSELGPLLLLGGRGETANVVERASQAAAAVNSLLETAAKRDVTLELRDKPAPGVGVSGSPAALLTVTPEDVAAYETWEAPARRRLSARLVAQFWAALLQDHVALFARRERPVRVVELSPRGRALLQIYAESARRSGPGAGVPTGVVSPLPAGLARDLREMALQIPTEGQAQAAAAVEGRWAGTLVDEGGEKPIVVELHVQGARLSGTLSRGAGKVAMGVPLQDLAYEGSTLRFVAGLGGAPRQFSGTLKGGSISGSVRVGSREVGRFSLKYAE